ncbi:hypothetical protein MPER_15983, partial [Moniliophthora perniciosa FA553]
QKKDFGDHGHNVYLSISECCCYHGGGPIRGQGSIKDSGHPNAVLCSFQHTPLLLRFLDSYPHIRNGTLQPGTVPGIPDVQDEWITIPVWTATYRSPHSRFGVYFLV